MNQRSSVLQTRVLELVQEARRRRAHVHGTAMQRLTANQYLNALPILDKLGYAADCCTTKHGLTALGIAIARTDLPIVSILLESGYVRSLLVDHAGTTAFEQIDRLIAERGVNSRDLSTLKNIRKLVNAATANEFQLKVSV